MTKPDETCGMCGRVGKMWGRYHDTPLCHGDDNHYRPRNGRPTCYELWSWGERRGRGNLYNTELTPVEGGG